MLLTFRKSATAAIAALSIAAGAAAPAHALGKNERNFLKGLAAAVIVGAIVQDVQKNNRRKAAPVYREVPQAQPRYEQPRYKRKAHRKTHKTGRVIGAQNHYGSGVNATVSARVFNSYSYNERVRIQRQLSRFGYYHGSIDGTFGPRTHQAVYEFARAANKQDALSSTSGSYRVYDALLG